MPKDSKYLETLAILYMSQLLVWLRWFSITFEASTAHEITAHPGKVNGLLEKLSKDIEHVMFETAGAEGGTNVAVTLARCCIFQDSEQLEELMSLSKVGQPFRLRSHLIRLAGLGCLRSLCKLWLTFLLAWWFPGDL